MAKKGKSTIIPIGGLDSDSEARFVAPTDYRYSLNIRNGVAYINDQNVVTNVKGSVKVNYTLPAGTNKCIGSYEDKQSGTIIYFVWNSKQQHTILQYTPADTAPFGAIVQLAQYNFGWTSTEFITGIDLVNGKLLYWADSVMPRKLNIEKSALTGKFKTWDMFIPETVITDGIITFTFKDMNGVVIYTIGEVMTNPSSRPDIINDIATNLNANVNSPVTAEACACHLKFTEKVAGSVGDIFTDQLTPNGEFLLPIVPDNWYGLTLTDRMCDAGKWMPLFEPLPTFEQDTNYEPNYVQKKVFQFRLQYQYDDFEESALGVISQIPINNLGCDGGSNPLLNYIYIDFNEPELIEIPNLVLIKKVTVMAREHNEGNWRSIIILEPCDFLDTDDAGNLIARYKFYGDIGGRGVDLALVAKQYDNLPIEAGTQKFVKNRLNYGDVEIGRDAPDCVDAKAQMEFVEVQNPKIYKITGKIRILTYGLAREIAGGGNNQNFEDFFPSDSRYPFWQPPKVNSWNGILGDFGYPLLRGGIFHDVSRTENDFAFFGGGSYSSSSNGSFGIRAGMEDEYDQRIPEGGFPVYAAGTQYLTISKQKNVGLATDTNGALDTSNAARVTAIGEYLYNDNDVPFDLYNEFELNVPNGVYVIRLASHWCSFGVGGEDKLGKGFAYDLNSGISYQKTSTNTWATIDPNGTWVNKKEFTVTVNNGDVYIGEFVVADLAPPKDANISTDSARDYWQPINAYLVDDFGATNINDTNFNGASVEKTLVFYGGYVWTGAIATPLPITGIIEVGILYSRACLTDHNGYWFGIGGYYVNPESPPLINEQSYNRFQITATNNTIIRRTDTTIATGTVSDYFNKALNIQNFDSANADGSDVSWGLGLVYGFVTTNSAQSRASSARIFEGLVLNQDSEPVSGVSVVFENGRYSTTAIDGSYEMLGWYDANSENQAFYSVAGITAWRSALGRDGLLIFNVVAFCEITYPNGQTVYITIATSLYSIHKVIPNFFVTENDGALGKAHKRGGTYTYGLRLYDDLGRLCSVVKAFEMYVPFITEDIGKYGIENFSGVTYPIGTFKYGKPSIKWVLSSSTTFPIYAKYFQWMRTQNSIYGRYLQWVANQVTYLSATATSSTPEIETSFQNSDAVAIKVSLSNITSYYAANNDSQVSYAYQAGDRLRLIADRNLVNYSSANFPSIANNVNDFEITSYDSTTQSVIIKPNGFPLEIKSGTLFEIFNPKSVETVDGQLFYEVGEVFTVTNGVPDTLSGTFTNGDTYWRGRLIIVNDDATKFASAYPVVIEDASVSDFYPSLDEDIGRAGLIDPNFKQLRYPTRMQCSNVYIAGTTINGLASFESLNFKELDRAFGAMKRMFYVGQVMLTVHENKLVSNYIELRSLSDANTTDGLLAISDAYYGNNRPSQTDNGCQNGESCIEYNGLVWGIDAAKGLVWQYDNNGDSAISAYKMISFFKDFCVKGIEYCIPTYDKYRNELIFSIKNSEQTITIAYDNAKNRWSTFYSFTPEYFGAVGTNVVSFVNGELWIMDKNAVYNNFFGTQYDSRLTIIPNDNSELNKVWDAIKLENLEDANKMLNNWEVFNITNNNGQIGRLFKNKFRKIEYFFYTSFGRDGSDVSVQFPYVNGRELRSPYLIMEMKNDTTQQFQLRSVVIDFSTSEKT